jgi:hypothetical protein
LQAVQTAKNQALWRSHGKTPLRIMTSSALS